ncbi:MAG: acyltransferase family protein [Sedimenticola sp.]
MTEQSLTFRPDLQGLRAIAILLVLFAHAGLAIVPGGFIGVDVFFVLSGYLITSMLLCELEENGRIVFVRFYARRLQRLLPALIFMLSVSSGLAILILSGDEAQAQLSSAQYAATWTSNFYFVFTEFGYFDELANRDLFLHTWSLGVEEQFYLIWPVVLLVLFRFKKSRVRANQNATRKTLVGIGIAFIVSLTLSLYWTSIVPQKAFYLMPSRIWQLSLGAMVYLILRDDFVAGDVPVAWGSKAVTYLALNSGLVLIIGSAIVLHPHLAYPGAWALAPSFGAALVIIAGHALSAGSGGPLAHPVLVWLGDRSYSLYLWHWPIFVLGFSIGFKGKVIETFGLILLSVLASMLSFRLIEYPFWKGRLSHALPRQVILVGILVMVTVVFGLSHALRLPHKPKIDAEIAYQPAIDFPILYRMNCDAWHSHSRIEPCIFGVTEAAKTVVLLGDSIGAQWFSMIPEIFPKLDWRIVVFTKSACAMVDEDYYYPRIGRVYQVCTKWRNAVLDELDILKPELIIMGSASTYGFSQTQWVDGSARVFGRLSDSAKSVLVIPGTPSLDFDGPGCLARHSSQNSSPGPADCLAKDRLQQVEGITNFLGQAADRFANVHLLDLNGLVCPDRSCSAITDKGVVVFRDSQHLTDSFVRAQIPSIRKQLLVLDKILNLPVAEQESLF